LREARLVAPRLRGKAADPVRDLLVDAALLAAAHGDDDAMAQIRPVLIGLGFDAQRFDTTVAMLKLRHGDVHGCLAVLEHQVLARDPNHELGLALQARAWRTLGRSEWRLQTHALLATSTHPLAREVARSSL
jgi:hypothetical protein